MTKLKKIKRAIAGLTNADLFRLRDWLDAYESRRFDRTIQADIAAGKLDEIADVAIARQHYQSTGRKLVDISSR